MKQQLFLGGFAVSMLFASPTFADGLLQAPPVTTDNGGQKGANRRVRTNPGWNAVKGNFTLPTIKVPQVIGGLGTANVYASKPSFYLGVNRQNAQPSFEVDAGFQYEYQAIRGREREGGPTVTTNPGWGIFVNTKLGTGTVNTVNPPVVYAGALGAWRCGPGTPNPGVTDVDLLWTYYRFRSTNGVGQYGGYLQVAANGTTTQPLSEDNNNRFRAKTKNTGSVDDYFLSPAVTGSRVKRVVAITQGITSTNKPLQFPAPSGGIYQEDGSYLIGCRFSQGFITTQTPTATGPSFTPSQFIIWDSPATDNTDKSASNTGYYPGGNDKTLLGYHLLRPYEPDPGVPLASPIGHAKNSNPIFSFPGIPQNQWEDDIQSRYSDETVNISLRKFRPVGGRKIAPGNAKFTVE